LILQHISERRYVCDVVCSIHITDIIPHTVTSFEF